MQLLVSVSTASEAEAAAAGGADIIDGKDPAAGALGAVTIETFDAIRLAAGRSAPLSAALGDAPVAEIDRLAGSFAAAGAAFVKIGFAGVDAPQRIAGRLALAVRGVALARRDGPASSGGPASEPTATERGPRQGVIAVWFADAAGPAVSAHALIDLAAAAGACGVLIDTVDKRGPGLRGLVPAHVLERWVRHAHDAALLAAVAGRIDRGDMAFVRDAGADIVGVRGAACDGGRTGRVVPEKVRLLRQLVRTDLRATEPEPPGPGRRPRTLACHPTS